MTKIGCEKRFDVSAGVIVCEGKVLICQRDDGDGVAGLWEFPGGKCRPGETLEDCLVRELREELDILVRPGAAIATAHSQGSSALYDITFFLTRIAHGTPTCRVHRAADWVSPDALDAYPFCPADASVLGIIRASLA